MYRARPGVVAIAILMCTHNSAQCMRSTADPRASHSIIVYGGPAGRAIFEHSIEGNDDIVVPRPLIHHHIRAINTPNIIVYFRVQEEQTQLSEVCIAKDARITTVEEEVSLL